ncbi:MAG: ATP-binding cassette domain-containing protein [Lachnospiraceae bacterium]|nr:ATP-binding cassette domain-containing protein [Lachnospiraceae bacterium]
MEIVINNLCKNYRKKKALENVSITIRSGMYGLLGRNGAGKTSLMRILATLSVPSSGEVSINGIPIKDVSKIREIVGYLPQDFSFYKSMSVYDAMDYLGLLSNIPDKVRKERILTLLERVNLKENVKTKVSLNYSRQYKLT